MLSFLQLRSPPNLWVLLRLILLYLIIHSNDAAMLTGLVLHLAMGGGGHPRGLFKVSIYLFPCIVPASVLESWRFPNVKGAQHILEHSDDCFAHMTNEHWLYFWLPGDVQVWATCYWREM